MTYRRIHRVSHLTVPDGPFWRTAVTGGGSSKGPQRHHRGQLAAKGDAVVLVSQMRANPFAQRPAPSMCDGRCRSLLARTRVALIRSCGSLGRVAACWCRC